MKLSGKLAKNGVWAFAGQIGSTIMGICYFGLLARLLPRDEMGVYFLLVSLTMLFSIVGALGVPEAMVRLIAQHSGAEQKTKARSAGDVGLLMVLQTAIVSAVIVVLLLNSHFISSLFKFDQFEFNIFIIGAWVIVSSMQTAICEYFRGMHDIKFAVLFDSLGKNVLSVLVTLAAWLTLADFTLSTALICAALALLLNNTLGLLLLKNRAVRLGKRHHYDFKTIVRIALPLCANMLLVFSLARFGIWVLGAATTPSDVALYGAAMQFVMLISMPLLVVRSVVPPLIASEYFNSQNLPRLEQTLRSVTTAAGIPSLLALILVTLLGSEILQLVYGEEYSEAHKILILLAIGQATNVLVGPTGALLKMTDHQSVLLKINLFFGITSAVLALIFALNFGAVGVAFVTGASMVINNLYTLHIAKQRTGISCAFFFHPSNYKLVIKSVQRSLGRI